MKKMTGLRQNVEYDTLKHFELLLLYQNSFRELKGWNSRLEAY